MKMFNENSKVSWRKVLTFLVGIVFFCACSGFLWVNKFAELPGSYQVIISGVFVFYFAKDVVRSMKITNSTTEENKNIDQSIG